MLTNKELKQIIKEHTYTKNTVFREIYVNKILSFIDRKEILVIKGIRRCGKTTILKQIISSLKDKKCVYVNLDDFRFLEHKSLNLLENILKMYLSKEKVYLFLDEIQTIPHFESWIRTHYDKETNVKFIVSGSSSSLMSKNLGTLMTGRTITFEIMPLSFKEFQDFSQGNIQEYLKYGGFPEIVLEKDHYKKKELLTNYFNTIIEKDILEKYGVQQSKQLRELLKYILSNPGIRISANKLSKQLGISINTVKSYLLFAEEVYLLFEVPFFSYSAKTKFIGARVSKYYCIDNGFTNILINRFEKSKVYENSVALHFFFDRKDLYYWKGKNEVDFVVKDLALNVVSSKNIPKREFLGLEEIKKEHKYLKKTLIICAKTISKTNISLKEFLLN